ncbi:hypothetical protein [Candidatus Mycoplasma haematominutum]|nr:hypothetical protein [Candidatus Mycoplasma haematominutum]
MLVTTFPSNNLVAQVEQIIPTSQGYRAETILPENRKIMPELQHNQKITFTPKGNESQISKTSGFTSIEVNNSEYQEFIANLIHLLTGPLWWDNRFKQLWIYKVEATLPIDQLEQWNNKLNKSGSNVISLTLAPTETQRLTTDDTEIPTELAASLNARAAVAYHFFDKDWKFNSASDAIPINNARGSEHFATTKFELISNHDNMDDPLKANVLRFTRTFGGKEYYLDIYFYGKRREAQLKLQMVRYQDKTWRSSAYYQANGSWSKWRNHIGGNREMTQKMGQTWTELDEEFAHMFEKFRENPSSTFKFFRVISRCLNLPECATQFHQDHYSTIQQKAPGVDRSNSWNPLYYRNIHPFSEMYYNN